MPVHVGRYTLGPLIGRGGMGEVYQAYDERLRRHVAIKRIRSAPMGEDGQGGVDADEGVDARRRARLLREARLAAKLAHPAIVQVFDIVENVGEKGREGDWVVMELVEGRTLASLLDSGPVPLPDVLRYAEAIADALDAAHRLGIIHRDLKLENAMVSESGQLKILDFGLAKQLAAEEPAAITLSVEGQVLGTVRAMSPEQARGLAVDARSDLFSFGVLLYELLGETTPFGAATVLDTLVKVGSHRQTPLHELDLAEPVPRALSELVDQLLEKAPELRPPSAAEVRTRLRAIRQWRGEDGHGADKGAADDARGDVTGARRSAREAATAETVDAVAAATTPPPVASSDSADSVAAAAPPSSASSDQSVSTAAVASSPPAASSDASVSIAAVASSPPAALSDHAVSSAAVITPPPSPSDQTASATTTPRRRRRILVGSLLLLVLALAIALSVSLFATPPSRSPSPRPSPTPSATAVASPPRDPRAAYEHGMALLRTFHRPGAVDEAAGIFQQLLRDDDASAPAYAGLARAYWHRFVYTDASRDPMYLQQAAAAAARAVALDALLADAHISRGLVSLEQGQGDAAAKDFQTALTLDAQNADAHDGLARVAMQREQLDEAVAEFRKAIALAPTDRHLYDDLGALLVQRGAYDDATPLFEQSIALAPDSPYGYSNLGAVHLLQGHYDEAAARFQDALKIRPSASLYSNLGTVLFAQGLYGPSASAFERALAMGGAANHHLHWGNLADAYRQLPGSGDKAREAYDHALALIDEELARTPKDSTLRSRRALYLAKRGDCAGADAELATLQTSAQLTPYGIFRIAVALELCAHRPRALETLGRALAAGFSTAEIANDPELRGLRADPAYHRMIQRSKQPVLRELSRPAIPR